jgi:hypothetical protein
MVTRVRLGGGCRVASLAVLFVLGTALEIRAATDYHQPGFSESVVFSGLSSPTMVRFLPDGSVIVVTVTVNAGIFGDVPVGAFAADWIEDLYGRGITGGCQASPLMYCPNNPNTRGQMAVFLVKTFGLQ